MNDENLTFLSASEYGSFNFLGARYFGIPLPNMVLNASYREFIPVDFAGLNTNISEPLTSSTNMLGRPDGKTGFTTSNLTEWTYQGGLTQRTAIGGVQAQNALLNSLIHHRQGPYGWPTWKQIRGGNHPIIRF